MGCGKGEKGLESVPKTKTTLAGHKYPQVISISLLYEEKGTERV